MAKIVATASEKEAGRIQESKAAALATALGGMLDADLAFLAKAKQDWEGGPFRVMFTVTRGMTPEQIASLPDPKDETGNNPAWYKVPVIKDGKETVKEHYFYRALAYSLPGIVVKRNRIDLLKLSLGDPTKVNMSAVPQDIKDMEVNRRHAQIKGLEGEINGAVTAVTKAFELFHQLRRFEMLKGVEVILLYAIGEDGQELDGQDGRPLEIDTSTKTPIIVQTTNPRRVSIDTMRIGIGTFMRFDVDKAIEGKGTYEAVVNSAPKKGTNTDSNNGNAGNRNVNTIETYATVLNDATEYSERVLADTNRATFEAIRKLAHSTTKEGNDFFFNLCAQRAFLTDIVGDPASQVRYQAMINAGKKSAA